MITQTIDPHHFDQKTRRIRTQTAAVLKKWGLLPRFKRWRLIQDPSTGMIVLFGILNNRYIARHTSIPFSNYFDPRLLRDLADELQVQVVSCNSDGLRYAFILSRGQIDMLPTHIDYPFIDDNKLLVRVVYSDESVPQVIEPQIAPAGQIAADIVDDQTLIRRGVEAFLKVLDDIKLRDEAALQLSAQGLPEVVVIDEDEFNRRVAELNIKRQKINHLRRLMGLDLETGNLKVSKKMQQAMLYALANGGKLRRYRGGFWAMENWRHAQFPWFGTSTVEALVSRGLMSYSEWRDGRKGRFPVAAVVSKPPPVQLTD